MGRTNMRYPYPEAGGISQSQRAAGQPLPFTTEKHTGSGIEPGVSDCEATVLAGDTCICGRQDENELIVPHVIEPFLHIVDIGLGFHRACPLRQASNSISGRLLDSISGLN